MESLEPRFSNTSQVYGFQCSLYQNTLLLVQYALGSKGRVQVHRAYSLDKGCTVRPAPSYQHILTFVVAQSTIPSASRFAKAFAYLSQVY
jgi:hypothetical protein